MGFTSSQILQAFLLSCAIVIGLFLWQGHHGFNLADEGFLWYGTQRVMMGEVPIRDFMSYDPGRYYWSAALMSLWDDNGIIALRWAVASFQMLGLFVGLLLVTRSRSRLDVPLLALAAITLVVWMFPRHKLFDVSLSIMLIGVLTFLVRQASHRRFFLTGLAVGLAAVFGRNHGLYGVAGSLGVIAYLACRRETPRDLFIGFAFWMVGVVIGYLPILVLIAVVPGFASAFWESIRFLFEIGATNLALPVPWPWRIPIATAPSMAAARGVLAGLFFIAVVAFGVLSISWVMWQALRRKPIAPELVASAVLSLPYVHFVLSRADIAHLSQGIFPFLVGSFVFLSDQSRRIKWLSGTLLTGASLLVIFPLHPGWTCRVSHQCVDADIAGRVLKVDQGTENNLLMFKDLADRLAPNGRSFVVAPSWPGAYAMLGRRSPMWENYALFPRSEAFQRAEIDRIKAANPGFVLIQDFPLDGRDELRFRNTHRLIDQYVHDNFVLQTDAKLSNSYQLYKPR